MSLAAALARARNIADLRLLARKRLPRMVFDYIDGGADDERTLQQSTQRFREIELVWDALANVAAIDTSTTIMGQRMRLPFFISPTACSRLFNPRGGEIAVARAAEKAGIVYSCSTLGSTTMEDITAAISSPRWFQMYVWKDRGLLLETLARAKAAGFTAILLTVDAPVAGNRERDPANQFTVPPKVNWHTATHTLARPGYLWDLVTTPKITPANFAHVKFEGGIMDFINTQFDRTVTWDGARWLRENWDGKFAIKGLSTPDDARRAVAIGADAVWLSNHGGRQLDTSPATIDTLPAVADAVRGDADIVLDGGVRRGTDVVKALALGATAIALGRAYLWGLAAGGEAGVTRTLQIMESELVRAMQLLGRARISDLTRDLIFSR
jgi:L-lactate dehydrogenase (cytochrome)